MSFEAWLDRHFVHEKLYDDDDDPYIDRWELIKKRKLFGRWEVSLYLHKIHRGDNERHLHDHAGDWAAFILKGWYIEELARKWWKPCSCTKTCKWREPAWSKVSMRRVKRRRFSFRFMRAERLHRLTVAPGVVVWSLFFRLRKRRVWGFQTENGWIAHEPYLKALKEERA